MNSKTQNGKKIELLGSIACQVLLKWLKSGGEQKNGKPTDHWGWDEGSNV